MLNKKLLAAAIVGTLAAGNAVAANLSAPGGAIPAYFAKEIVIGTNGTQLTTSVPAAQLTWNIGYNFSQGEVRYARLECSNTIKFDAATVITLSDAAAGNVGSINGLGNLLLSANSQLDGPLAWAALVWLSALGIALFLGVVLAERLLMPWAEAGHH